MRGFPARALVVLAAAALAGCSVISVELTPRIRPLEETTVEGRGDAKILLIDISGVLSDEALSPVLTLGASPPSRSEEHTSELQSPCNLVCRLLLEKKKNKITTSSPQTPRLEAHFTSDETLT